MSDIAASVEKVEDVSLPKTLTIPPVVLNDLDSWKFSSLNVKAIAGWPSPTASPPELSIQSSMTLDKKDSSGNVEWECSGSAEFNVFAPSFAKTFLSTRLGLTRYITKDCFVSMSCSPSSGANVMVSLPVPLSPKKGLVTANLFSQISSNRGWSAGSVFRVDGGEDGGGSSTQITLIEKGGIEVQFKCDIDQIGGHEFGFNVDSRGLGTISLQQSFGKM
jgi:hypothetical protein